MPQFVERVQQQGDVALHAGDIDDAYAHYALTANRAGTYVAWFLAIAKKYPDKPAATILSDLVRLTPGDEGKWFRCGEGGKVVRRGDRAGEPGTL